MNEEVLVVVVSHRQLPCDNVPEGTYTVRVLPNSHPLGSNGSDKRWRYGYIVGGELDGRLVSLAETLTRLDVPAVSGPNLTTN